MKRSAKTILSLILAVAMLMSVCVMPASAEQKHPEVEGENGLYVYIGDSMTYDFVGSHNGYLDSTDIYAWQTARAMGYTTDDYGKFPGGRATDAYAALSETYNGDDYSTKELNEPDDPDRYLSGRRAERFQKAVDDANVISVQVGYSELTTFFFENLISYFDKGEMTYSCDLSQIFSQEELAKIMPFVSKVSKLIDTVIPDTTKTAFSTFLSGLSDTEKKAVVGVIGQDAFDTLSNVKDFPKALNDAIVYTMASTFVHFDALIREIYDRNPDVELYVMGLVNPVAQLRLGFELNGKDFSIPLGELAGGVFDIMNSYYRVLSPFSDKYYFVENRDHVETFAEAMVNDEELTGGILYALYNTAPSALNGEYYPRNGYSDDEVYARNANAYNKAKLQAPAVMQAIENTTMIDLVKVIKGLVNGDELDTNEKMFETIAQYDENGKTTASYVEQLGAHIAMAGILKGIYVHPTQAGHDAEAPLLIAAMQEKRVDPLARAYHALNAPTEWVIEGLDKSTTIDEFISWVENVQDIWSDDADDQGDTSLLQRLNLFDKINTFLINVIKTVIMTMRSTVTSTVAKLCSIVK